MARGASRLAVFFGAVVSIVYLLGVPAIAQDIPSAETYATHPRHSTAAISPDGDRLALVIPEDGGDRVVTMSFSDPND